MTTPPGFPPQAASRDRRAATPSTDASTYQPYWTRAPLRFCHSREALSNFHLAERDWAASSASGPAVQAAATLGSVPYSTTAYQLLVSAPSDLPEEDIRAAFEAVARWNVLYGRQQSATVVPTHWSHHSAAEHGTRPQESLNKQLVEDADVVIALFWHRLGSPTGEAESGTVEEIEEASAHGAYVGVLRCSRAIRPGDLDADQASRLEAFLDEVRRSSLILEYEGAVALRERVDTILTTAVTALRTRAEAQAEATAGPEADGTERATPSRGTEVWPRVERSESVRTDSKGRVKTKNRWQLVLSNTGDEPARRVRYRLEAEGPDDNLPLQSDDPGELEALAPHTDAAYTLFMHMGVADQARCVFTWEDSAGERENVATLRFF